MAKSGWLFRLEYKLETDKDYIVDNPKPVHWNPGSFEITVRDGIGIVEMYEPCLTVDEARQKVFPFLRSWEIDAMLSMGRSFEFKFVNAQPSSRETSPWSPPSRIKVSQVVAQVEYTIKKSEYPLPPKSFHADQDVEVMWLRFQDYLHHRSSLTTTGYFCLTVLEARAGNRQQAARIYGVDKEVLSNLGELTTTIGDRHVARKFANGAFRPHTKMEKRWIEASIGILIRRAGEITCSGTGVLPIITMNDLPSL